MTRYVLNGISYGANVLISSEIDMVIFTVPIMRAVRVMMLGERAQKRHRGRAIRNRRRFYRRLGNPWIAGNKPT